MGKKSMSSSKIEAINTIGSQHHPAERMQETQKKIEEFQKKLLAKFEGYIAGIALLSQPVTTGQDFGQTVQQTNIPTEQKKDTIPILVLIDDTDSQKMSKDELKQKLTAVIGSIGKEVEPKFEISTLIFSELWQYCYDAKYEVLQTIAMSTIIYDTGMLSAIKIAEVHKNATLKKFEKYIVSYVLAGSLVQGKATLESDIDVFIVIDDTDVKRMSRAELKDKLRAIITTMGIEAGQITGIKNKINIQTYILTDFWDSIKEANPVIFTFLRDGVPFYDRGIFMPWKQLLRMGKIRPSMEAIDIYMNSGVQVLDRVKLRLKEIALEDFFWATLTPSQAALMLYGVAPPTPKETPEVMREVFVKKEKLMEEKTVKILEKIVRVRKELEHGKKTSVTGKEIDELFEDATEYMKCIEQLTVTIEKKRSEQDVVAIYDTVVSLIREIIKAHAVSTHGKEDELKIFEKEVVKQGYIAQRFLRSVEAVYKAKEDYDKGKLGKVEVEKIRVQSSDLIKFLSEYIQRKRNIFVERSKLRIKIDEKNILEMLVGADAIFVIDYTNQSYKKAVIKDSVIQKLQNATPQDFEKYIEKFNVYHAIILPKNIIEFVQSQFGKNAQIIL
jgi:predicted nucleotidyltransferase/uncharacterized protein (UPF0332 family)